MVDKIRRQLSAIDSSEYMDVIVVPIAPYAKPYEGIDEEVPLEGVNLFDHDSSTRVLLDCIRVWLNSYSNKHAQSYANDIISTYNNVLRAYQGHNVDIKTTLVGYSGGGVVASSVAYALEDLGYAGLDRTNVVKIGSPNMALSDYWVGKTTAYSIEGDLVAGLRFSYGLANQQLKQAGMSYTQSQLINGLELSDEVLEMEPTSLESGISRHTAYFDEYYPNNTKKLFHILLTIF